MPMIMGTWERHLISEPWFSVTEMRIITPNLKGPSWGSNEAVRVEFLCTLSLDKQMNGLLVSMMALIVVCLVLSLPGLRHPGRARTALLVPSSLGAVHTHTFGCAGLNLPKACGSQACLPTEKRASSTAFVILRIAISLPPPPPPKKTPSTFAFFDAPHDDFKRRGSHFPVISATRSKACGASNQHNSSAATMGTQEIASPN